MSSNPYIVVGKLQVRRGSEYQLPGRPISINPTRFSETLDSGEFGLTTDTQRLFIGPNRAGVNALNDPNRAALFPYANIEVLTESSPRNRELFGKFWRDQDSSGFFYGTAPAGSGFSDFSDPAGARIDGSIMSGAVDYIAFFPVSGAIQQGTFFFQADASNQTVSDTNPIIMGNPNLTFQISAQQGDETGSYFTIQVQNESSETAEIYLRRRFISIGDGGVVETIAFFLIGKFGYMIEGISGQYASTTVLAIDNLNYNITYSTPPLPGTLTIDSNTGEISGDMPVEISGAYINTTVTATSTTGLSTTAPLAVLVQPVVVTWMAGNSIVDAVTVQGLSGQPFPQSFQAVIDESGESDDSGTAYDITTGIYAYDSASSGPQAAGTVLFSFSLTGDVPPGLEITYPPNNFVYNNVNPDADQPGLAFNGSHYANQQGYADSYLEGTNGDSLLHNGQLVTLSGSVTFDPSRAVADQDNSNVYQFTLSAASTTGSVGNLPMTVIIPPPYAQQP